MAKCDLLKVSFVRNFRNKKCVGFSLTFFGNEKQYCIIKTVEMFIFRPLINIFQSLFD